MILVWLLVAAALLSGVSALVGQRHGPVAGWVASAGMVALGVVLAVQSPGAGVGVDLPWIPALDVGLRFHLDGLGMVFGLVVLGIGALVMAYAASYLPPGRHGLFYGLLTFFAVAMLALVTADDIVVVWFAWELTTLCSFLLVAQTGPDGKGPAIRTLIVTGAGGLCLLTAVCLMWVATGTTRLREVVSSPAWAHHPHLLTACAVLVALAACTKAAQWPFHSWLPDAMVASTPVSAYLHAAAMVKAGIFVLLRFSPLFVSVTSWHVLLVTLGLVSAFLGALFALQRTDLKELLAYSTVSQLGFLVATIGVGTGAALMAGVVHVVAHALFKSSLFMSVGIVDHETGTRSMGRLSGLGRAMPLTATAMVVAAASMAGLPPLLGFVSKESMFEGLAEAGEQGAPAGLRWVVVVTAVLAASLTVAYSARMLRPLFGPAMDEPPHEAPVAMWLPVALPAAAGIVLGPGAGLMDPLVAGASRVARGEPVTVALHLWHGFTLPLAMTAVAIGLGVVLVVARHRLDVLLDRRLWPVRAADLVDSLQSATIALGGRVNAPTRHDAPFRHVLVPLVGLAGIGLVAGLAASPPWRVVGTRPSDWIFAALVVGGVGLTLRARSRVGLVTIVGIVGFSTSLLYFVLGAPDVALTQLLVETLTVTVMVLLLVRLPYSFHETGRARVALAAVVAVLVAAAGFVVALVVLGEEGRAPVLDKWFLEHAEALTGGTNVVNTILVDFRALDTLGELTALGVAGVALVVALESRGLLPLGHDPVVVPECDAARPPADNLVTLAVLDKVVTPLLFGLSVWFYLRGHHAPGGGFIAALVAAAAIVLMYLSQDDDSTRRMRVSSLTFIGAGILVAVLTAALGYWHGAFLAPLHGRVAGIDLSTTLLFDLGVYLAVLGLVMAAVGRLGRHDRGRSTPVRQRTDVTVADPQEGL